MKKQIKNKEKRKIYKRNNLRKSMKKLRPIRKYSGVWMIKLSPIDILDFQLKEGDLVDISDIIKEKVNNKEVKNE